MLMPIGSKRYDIIPGGVVFQLAGHTAALPKLVTIKRKLPDAAGFSSYEIKLVRGIVQAAGLPARNQIWTLSIRNVPGQVGGDTTALRTAMTDIMASVNFANDVGTTLLLPIDTDVAV